MSETTENDGPLAVYIPGEGVILPDGRFVTEAQWKAAIRWVKEARRILIGCGVIQPGPADLS